MHVRVWLTIVGTLQFHNFLVLLLLVLFGLCLS